MKLYCLIRLDSKKTEKSYKHFQNAQEPFYFYFKLALRTLFKIFLKRERGIYLYSHVHIYLF